MSLAESEVLPGWEGDSFQESEQAEIISPSWFVPQEAWYEKGNERADPTRPQQRHQREQEPTERGGMVQTEMCGQTQRWAVLSGLLKQQRHLQQF